MSSIRFSEQKSSCSFKTKGWCRQFQDTVWPCIVYRLSRYKITQLLLNNHSILKLSSTFIYLKVYMTWKIFSAYLKGLSKYTRIFFRFRDIVIFVLCKLDKWWQVSFCSFCDAHLWCQVSRTLLQYFQRYFFIQYFTMSRENEGTERDAPSQGLGICQFHLSYF